MSEQHPDIIVEKPPLTPATKDGLVWERLKGEARASFQNFAAYRDMGPARSIRKLAEELSKNATTLFEQSVKYRWQERTELYDDFIDRRQREALEGERERLNREGLRIARGMMLMGGRRLIGDREVTALRAQELDAAETFKAIETGWRMARTATGQPTDVIRGLFNITSDDLVRVVQGLYEIASRLVPEERRPRLASEFQAFLEGGGHQ